MCDVRNPRNAIAFTVFQANSLTSTQELQSGWYRAQISFTDHVTGQSGDGQLLMGLDGDMSLVTGATVVGTVVTSTVPVVFRIEGNKKLFLEMITELPANMRATLTLEQTRDPHANCGPHSNCKDD
jgi:hypothetical protein